jgi:GT2 family glycosyltransferase/spore maturation protein CgeB
MQSDGIVERVSSSPEGVVESIRSPIESPSLISGAVYYSDGIASGWVKLADSDKPVEIDVLVDGVVVWSGFARRKLASGQEGRLASDDKSAEACGFRVLLPDPPSGSAITDQLLHVRAKNGLDVPGSPLRIPYGDQFIGYIEALEFTQDSLIAYGWSIDKRQPSSPVRLTVHYAGTEICAAKTGIARSDLSSTGYDAPGGGFTFTIPKPTDFDHKLLEVFPGRSAAPLRLTDDARLPHHLQAVTEDNTPTAVYGLDDDFIEGTIDHIDERLVRGWARNATNPAAVVLLDCFIDGHLYSTTAANRFRPDLAKHFGDHGFHEYRFELSPGIARCFPGKMQVVPRIGKSNIKHKIETLPHILKRSRVIPPRQPDVMLSHRFTGQIPDTTDIGAALIVINRNGAQLLDNLFQTFQQHNRYEHYEFVIVDHASTDRSEAVVATWSAYLNVRWLPRGGNFSFSDSNNYAAARTSAPALVFVNNDVAFSADILEDLLRYLGSPEIGCVGIKLLDDCPVGRADGQVAIQHLGVHIDDRNTGLPLLPFETRWSPTMHCVEQAALEVPAVTAAFMACRREDFLDMGGFSELYFYGQEDVDLCLKFAARAKKIICANHLSALHLRGFSRAKMDQRYARARTRNVETLESRFGAWVQRKLYQDRFVRPGFWSSMVPRIAFAVTEATQDTLAGDYFTALELASQLSAQFPCITAFVEVIGGTQYNLADFDVVIAMRDDYDPRRIQKAPSHLLKIAWVRNWFDRFANRDSASLFDLVWASSPSACAFLEEKLGRKVELVPIATNLWRFQSGKADPKLKSDYCFTGSYWNLNREIIQMLDPAALPFDFAIFGTGWDKIPHLAPFSRGSLPYARMPDVYAGTKLVIDDANHVTKSWGAVNSRVFDGIAAGALVVTNGKSGSDALFDGALPTYDTPQALEDLLWLYLSDEAKRREKVTELQDIVKRKHTYQLRARGVWRTLAKTSAGQLRIAIKIGAPSETVKADWGDYHFAASLKFEFDKMGHSTRIDCLDAWKCGASVGDHLVIVLRGLSAYQPRPHQINVMWNISHPDKISDHEYRQYDHVFVASELHALRLAPVLGDRVSVLLQCTDPRLFHPGLSEGVEPRGVLFVGNSRGQMRPIVRDAIAAGLPLEIYGGGWEGLIPEQYLKGTHISNGELGRHYAAAAVVLNDHWDNMRDAGFISNRVFDVLACGGRLISDPVPGINELFRSLVALYRVSGDLAPSCKAMNALPKADVAARQQLAAHIVKNHSFLNRAHRIVEIAGALASSKFDLCRSVHWNT